VIFDHQDPQSAGGCRTVRLHAVFHSSIIARKKAIGRTEFRPFSGGFNGRQQRKRSWKLTWPAESNRAALSSLTGLSRVGGRSPSVKTLGYYREKIRLIQPCRPRNPRLKI
jgi:hypothetical protein